MSNITVWTKQHENVLKELETTGRYCKTGVPQDGFERTGSSRAGKLMTGW